MRVVKCKVSHDFLGRIFRNEVELSQSELPKDVRVAGVKGDLEESWFWVYFQSREFVDVDPELDVGVPEVTLWFGPRRK